MDFQEREAIIKGGEESFRGWLITKVDNIEGNQLDESLARTKLEKKVDVVVEQHEKRIRLLECWRSGIAALVTALGAALAWLAGR